MPSRGPRASRSRTSRASAPRLAQEQAAAAPVEGPHLVARERAQGVEAAHHEAAERVVAARHHRVGLARAQQIGADRQRGGAGRARGGHRDHRAARAEPAREGPARAVVERLGQPAAVPVARERLLAFLHAPERGAHHHRDPRRIERQRAEAGLRAEVVGRRDQQAASRGSRARRASP